MTANSLLKSATHRLATRSASARLDAEILLAQVLGVSRSGLTLRAEHAVPAAAQDTYHALIEARAAGAPVAYLTGSQEFWSLDLQVSTAVLVPRPETEILVERALGLIPKDRAASVLDLGTGSGAIALAIAVERPLARITGVEICAEAVGIARANARALKLDSICWLQGSWFEKLAGVKFDVIISNPPYVAADDPHLAALQAEPALALTPGPTGLEAFASIVREAPAHLNDPGWLAFEHGSTQGEPVAKLLERHGFVDVRSYPDYQGLTRVTLGRVHSISKDHHD
jgi:release factor glutamine methyltransferase